MISHQKSLKDPRCDPWDGKMYQAIFSLVPCGHVSPEKMQVNNPYIRSILGDVSHHTTVQPCGMRHAGMPCGMARGMTSKKSPSSRVRPQPRHAFSGFIGFCASFCWRLSSDEDSTVSKTQKQRDATKKHGNISKTSNFKHHFFDYTP